MFANKKLNLAVLSATLLLLCSLYLYWELVCKAAECTYQLRNDFLRPLAQSGINISAVFTIFLFLPAAYFNSWFKYIFSWAFPLSIVLVNILHSETSWLVISKTDVVRLMGMVFGVVTVIFIVAKWYLSRR